MISLGDGRGTMVGQGTSQARALALARGFGERLAGHHVYWRFDFDLEGTPSDDVVREINPMAGTEITFTNEADRTWGDPADGHRGVRVR